MPQDCDVNCFRRQEKVRGGYLELLFNMKKTSIAARMLLPKVDSEIGCDRKDPSRKIHVCIDRNSPPSSLAIGYANEHNSTRFIETIQHIRIQDSTDQGLDLMQYTQTRSRFSCHKAISCITHDKSADSNENPVVPRAENPARGTQSPLLRDFLA